MLLPSGIYSLLAKIDKLVCYRGFIYSINDARFERISLSTFTLVCTTEIRFFENSFVRVFPLYPALNSLSSLPRRPYDPLLEFRNPRFHPLPLSPVSFRFTFCQCSSSGHLEQYPDYRSFPDDSRERLRSNLFYGPRRRDTSSERTSVG